MTSILKGDMEVGNASGNFGILNAPSDGMYNVADSTQALGYNSRVATPAPGSQSYSSVSLAFNTARTPNSTYNTLVVVTCSASIGLGQTSTINFIINSTTISSQTTSNSITVALGSMTTPINCTFLVPAGSSYKITQSGSATNTISSIYEITV